MKNRGSQVFSSRCFPAGVIQLTASRGARGLCHALCVQLELWPGHLLALSDVIFSLFDLFIALFNVDTILKAEVSVTLDPKIETCLCLLD